MVQFIGVYLKPVQKDRLSKLDKWWTLTAAILARDVAGTINFYAFYFYGIHIQ